MNADHLGAAWRGGPARVEALLAADVQLVWWSGDEAPCRGRDEVIPLIQALADPTTELLPALIFEDVADDVVLAHDSWGQDDPNTGRLALAVYSRGDQVVTLVQYGSREHALQHLTSSDEAATPSGHATLPTNHPLADAAVDAIHSGDLDTLNRLLDEHPELAAARLGTPGRRGMTRTLLHVATDWPGHFPSAAQAVALLVQAGADVNARFAGPHEETPLHWAASSNDVDVLDALIDAGADIEARGAVIGGGTPLSDATAFGQWEAARRLIERGATATLGEAASLGLLDHIEDHLNRESPHTGEITGAFWMACHGSQLAAAQLLYQHGADINWIGWDNLTPYDAAQRSQAADVTNWLEHLGARKATHHP
jgi:hypothetical protein